VGAVRGSVPARCLAPGGVVEARPVAAGHVQVAVRPERQVADGVGGELLAPLVGDQRLLDAGGHAGDRGDRGGRQVAGDGGAVGGGTGRARAVVTPAGRAALRVVVVGVEHVDVVAAGGGEAPGGPQTHPAPGPV